MCGRDLSGCILKNVRKRSLQDAGAAAVETSSMVAQLSAASARLDADEAHFLVLEEDMKNADRVRAAAHAGDDGIRKAAFGAKNLRSRFAADHRLEIAHHRGIRMCTQRAPQQV